MSEDRDAFIPARRPRWNRLENLLSQRRLRQAEDWSELSKLYRSTCADLASAQARELPRDILAYLDQLSGRAHNRLYAIRRRGGLGIAALLYREFPIELRKQWALFLVANLFFYGPMTVGIVGSLLDSSFAFSILPESQLKAMESMYSSSEMERAAGEDAAMAGFYVWNNVGIAFRCFATGALAGLGSVFYLVYNGLVLGAVKGHLFSVGYGMNLLSFIAGHGPWELTGVVVAGTAGLKLGYAMVVTDGRTRAGSLKAAGPSLYRLVTGATGLLLVAAAIEGFWSAGPVPPAGKYAFGLFQIIIVAAWILLGGRGRK